MGFFRLPRFIRRYIRRRTLPIPEETAFSTKKNLSFFYAFLTWNLFGYIIYKSLNRTPSEERENQPPWWHGRVVNLENATHYRVQGFNINKVEGLAKVEPKDNS